MARRITVLCVILLAALGYLLHVAKPEVIPIREPLRNIPMSLEEWQGIESPDLHADVLAVLGVDDYINRSYYAPDHSGIGLYIGYYRSQREGDTIHSPLNCLPGAGWNVVKRNVISIPAGSKSNISVNSIIIAKGAEKQEVLYWYQSHGRVIASEYWGKVYMVLDALRLNRTDGALVRITTPVLEIEESAETKAEERGIVFIKILFPLLGRFLPA